MSATTSCRTLDAGAVCFRAPETAVRAAGQFRVSLSELPRPADSKSQRPLSNRACQGRGVAGAESRCARLLTRGPGDAAVHGDSPNGP